MNYHSCGSEPQAGGTGRATKFAAILAASLLLASCADRKAQAPGKPPKQGPPRTVTLVPSGSGSNTTWMVRLDGGAPQNPETATTKIGHKVGPTKFTVNIAGNPADIQFKAQDPLTVWAGAKSAPQPGIDTQILGPILTDQGQLVFWDLNMGAAVKLSYSIHFEGDIPSVDPIIDNGGNEN